MVKTLKNKAMRALSVFVCFALALGVFAAVLSLRGSIAYADDAIDYTNFKTEAISITNNQFSSSTGSAPKTPSGWTAGGIGESGAGGAFGGILELDNYQANKESYKIDTFAPSDAPNSPFGPSSSYEGTNRNVLLVNVPESNSQGTAYGYTSSNISLTANRYYHITVWVRTCDFTQRNANGGAAIRLNGLDDDVAFNNINTVTGLTSFTAANNYGWEQYEFYIATASYAAQTITISLQVGDRYTDANDSTKNLYKPATGYALFDNVQAYQISPAEFLNAQTAQNTQASDNTIVKDYSSKTSAHFAEIENLDFTQDLLGWDRVVGKNSDVTGISTGVYNGYIAFSEDNEFFLTSDPVSSLGKYSKDSNILVISSYTSKSSKKNVAAGYSTQKFVLERYHYYRLSVWVKTQDVSGGNGATFALSVIRNENDEEYEGSNLYSTITSCTGESDNRARGGFKEYAFYVKGSVYDDYQASVECMLGTEGNESSGIAMFDNITLEEITPAQYTANSSNGTVVNLDTDGSGITYPTTGITNGVFYDASYEINKIEDFAYPLAPANWTQYNAETAGTLGYANDAVDLDTCISGIIPTDRDTFNAYQDKFGTGSRNPHSQYSSALMLYSENDTAYGYRSSAFTVTADTVGKVTVRLDAADLEGYGASLVLKSGDSVIATIEKIKHEDTGFKTYTFYIEASDSDVSLTVEIWMGMQDRQKNLTKLAKGHLYVESVSYASVEDIKDGDTVLKSAAEQFKEFKKAIEDAKHTDLMLTEAAYSYKTIDFSSYDYYDTSDLKHPYDWTLNVVGGENETVHYGIFDASKRPAYVPDSFTNTQGATDNGVLLLFNAAPAYSQLTYNGSITLKADNYYKVDVAVKVKIPQQDNKNAVGAKIMLLKDGSATKYVFKDIFDTTEKHDDTVTDEFRTYTFYIKAGGEDSTLSLRLSIGDTAQSKWCSGQVYVNKITYTDITNVTYDDAISQIDNGNLSYAQSAEMSDAAPVEDEEPASEAEPAKNELSWWLIPSILFAIAIVIAVVGFFIRKLLERGSKKKGVVEKTVSYDRRNTLNATHNENADEEDKISDVEPVDESYNSFDDDKTVEP
ncbi:MAG: hypothetical protein K2M95_07335, partial [Clostridiales bacterium]|nr:hypothetical protein [Clostridiales bacterium]